MVARSKFYEVQSLNVHELILDSYNPRIRHGVDQHDCVARIIKDRDTFLTLLRDIAIHGLSPEHILISKNEDGKWVVRDGNRRITALKILTRPEICLPNEQMCSIVQRIVADMPVKPIDTVTCLACDDEATVLDYLKRKHTGENSGVGQVGWSALLISLFNTHVGVADQNRRAAQLIIWAEDHGLSVENDFPITTLTRALNGETLKFLGFSVDGDQLKAILHDNQAYALVARIVNDIASGRVHVKRDGQEGSIYSPEDAVAYVRRVREEMGPKENAEETTQNVPKDGGPNAPKEEGGAGTVTNSPERDQAEKKDGPSDSKPSPWRPPAPKPAWDRPCLFGRRKNSNPGISVPSTETKVNTILGELRQLDPNSTPLAVAMLLRALIERSEINYRRRNSLQDKGALHKNIAAAADKMKGAGLLNDGEHDVLMRHTRHEAGMLHIKTIQAYIHEAEFHPNAQTLNTMWDELGSFVRACWLD